MSPYLYFTAIFMFLTIHAVWMGLFAMEVLFDTSRSTAAERGRTLAKYVFFGLGLEVALGLSIWLFIRSIG